MPFSGGTFTRLYNWVNDAAGGIKILASRMDAEMNGFATGLSTCVTKDGQTTITANLPMSGFKHTNVANATALTEYLAAGQLISNNLKYYTASGTDTYTITPSPAITAYAAGQSFKVKFTNANTSTATLNVNGLGAKALVNRAGAALSAGQIPAGAIFDCDYDGTSFMIDTVASTEILPPGMVAPFAGASAPTGWLLCYGQAVSRTTYAALFTAISTVYGSGDGSTTFNLPDLRGRAVFGQDDMGGTSANRLTGITGSIDGDTLGAAGGSESNTLTTTQLPAHTHTGTTAVNSADHTHSGTTASDGAHTHGVPSDSVGGSDVSFAGRGQNSNDGNITTTSSGAHTHTFTTGGQSATHTHTITTDSTGSGAAYGILNPALVLNYIIKV